MRADGPDTVVQCEPGRAVVLVVATSEATVPTGDPATLARRLNAAVPKSKCEALP